MKTSPYAVASVYELDRKYVLININGLSFPNCRLTRLLFSVTEMACLVAGMKRWLTLCADLLMEGNGYEARQTPKELTKMLRLATCALEGP